MWNKIKWVLIGVSIAWMFYINYQTNKQMRDRIDRIDVETTGRHIMYFELGKEDLSEFDLDYCIIQPLSKNKM